jgi:hypothetical protein
LPFLIVGLWLLMSAVFAMISGWLSLSSRFRATERPEGTKIIGQVKRMGIVPENRVTHIIVSERGLYLYVSFLFRAFHPALLIPWSEVRLVRVQEGLWWHNFELDLASGASLVVKRRAFESIRQYLSVNSP